MSVATQNPYKENFIATSYLLIIPLFLVSVSLFIYLYDHPTVKIAPFELCVVKVLYTYCVITGSVLLVVFERAKNDPNDRRLIRVLRTSFHLSAITPTGLLLISAFMINDFGDYLKYLLVAVNVFYLAGSYFRDELRLVPGQLSRLYESCMVSARIIFGRIKAFGSALKVAYRILRGELVIDPANSNLIIGYCGDRSI